MFNQNICASSLKIYERIMFHNNFAFIIFAMLFIVNNKYAYHFSHKLNKMFRFVEFLTSEEILSAEI